MQKFLVLFVLTLLVGPLFTLAREHGEWHSKPHHPVESEENVETEEEELAEPEAPEDNESEEETETETDSEDENEGDETPTDDDSSSNEEEGKGWKHHNGDDDDSKGWKHHNGDDDDGKGWKHHQHHKGGEAGCHFQNGKATYDLRLLMRDMNGKDWELMDETTETTYLFNPCKGVTDQRCPQDAALCSVGEKDIGVSFGSAGQKQWTEIDNGVEISYAGGELCSNSIARKTVLQLLCSQPTADPATHKTVLTEFKSEDCMVSATITTPYGCPVEQLCTVYEKTECEASESLCEWKGDKCVHSTSNCLKFGRHHLSVAAILGIAVSTGALALCGLTACVCMCCVRRRRILRQRKAALPVTKKGQQIEEEQQMEMPQMTPVVYQPMQQMGVPFPQMYNPLVFQTREGMVQFVPTQNE